MIGNTNNGKNQKRDTASLYADFVAGVPKDPAAAFNWIRDNNFVVFESVGFIVIKNAKYHYPDGDLHLTIFLDPEFMGDADVKRTLFEWLNFYSDQGYYYYKNPRGVQSVQELHHWHVVENYYYWRANFA